MSWTNYSYSELIKKFPIKSIVTFKGKSLGGSNIFDNKDKFPYGVVTNIQNQGDSSHVNITWYQSKEDAINRNGACEDWGCYGEQIEIVVDTTNMLNFIETQLDRLEEKLKQ